MLLVGVYFCNQTLLDMWDCDVFGFDHIKYFKKEGCELPVPFKMKNLSNVALSCRNPLMTG
jgi:hypothetical protein